MQKKLFVIIVFLLSLSVVIAQTDDLFYSNSLLLDMTLKSNIKLVQKAQDSKIDYAKVNLQYFPLDSYNQEVLEIKTTPDGEKNFDSYLITWIKPFPGTYEYSLESKIRTNNKFTQINKKIKFPILSLDPELKKYTQATEKVDITPAIIAKASQLAEGEDDLAKVVFNLASWTKQNIQYNLTTKTIEASQKASWVMSNRYGVCDELTNLFLAMARSLGIPVRFVSGISYTNSVLFANEWGLHGWAEVYFPGYGWVPVDPTYGQYFQLDATHIKLKDSLDSEKSSSKFEWLGTNVDLIPGKLQTDVTILGQGEKASGFTDIIIIPLSKEVSPGSYNLIEAKLKNNKNHYIAFEAYLSKPKELMIIGEHSRYIFLGPLEEKSVYWIVQVDKTLSRNYQYTLPVGIYTTLGDKKDGLFKAYEGALSYSLTQITKIAFQYDEQSIKTYSKNLEILCYPAASIFVNETFTLECDITNNGNVFLQGLRVCLEERQCIKEDIGISQSKHLKFETTAGKAGEQEIRISARNSDVSSFKQVRIFASEKPRLTIEKVIYPEILSYGPDFEITFSIWKHSVTKPVNATVKFLFNEKETPWKFDEVDSNKDFDVKMDKSLLSIDGNSFSIELVYHDAKGIEYSETYKRSIILKEPSIWGKIELRFNALGRAIERFFEGFSRE